ncbi:MAG: GNAT family N-acetyltransferase [Ferruginibacter sp.]
MISIVPYQEKYLPDFKRLNMEWLDKYNLTEQYDLDILNDPEGAVIDKGGCIFIALEGDRAIGTAGLSKINNLEYELVKMAVDPACRGKGIGKKLLSHCLDTARNLHAEKISLYSNSQLQTALQLYGQFGFMHVEVTGSPLLTADVKMELSLINNQD